jgi:very-short-patch-repair endonuclease
VDFKLIVRARWDFNEYADAETVVECDGHDFHERTKEQAASDKARDRALQALGMRVLRFTGSEIWSDPLVCAREALAVTYRAAHEVAMDRIAGSAGR